MPELHLWAVLVAAFAKFVLGGLWFSPMMFVNPWMRALGIKPGGKDGLPLALLVFFVGNLLMAFVLAHGIRFAQMAHGLPEGLAGGLLGGLICWLGFVAAPMADAKMSEKRPLIWFAITGGYHLVGMLMMGVILAAWA